MSLFSFKYSNIKPVSYSELSMPKKRHAPIADQTTSNAMDLQPFVSSVSNANTAKNDLFGNALTSKNETSFPGFNSGFKKVIPSADFLNFPDIANPKSSKSKIIGFTNLQSTISFFPKSSTPFMTEPTSTEITASSLL